MADGNIIVIHTLDVDDLVDRARADVSRQMTDAECQRFLRRECDA